MKTLLCIDPGKSGGIAVENEYGTYCDPMPDTFGDTVDYLREVKELGGEKTTAYVEAVPSFCGPKLPGSVVFVMAENFGVIQGALMALNIPLVLVRPQEWQKGLGIGTKAGCVGATNNQKRTLWKRKLKGEAQRRFPTLKVTEKTADALLILEWARSKQV